jgi:uncharacterized protein YjbJ (UPF0337 family)
VGGQDYINSNGKAKQREGKTTGRESNGKAKQQEGKATEQRSMAQQYSRAAKQSSNA